MARDIVAEVRDLDTRLKKITTEMSRVLGEHGTHLTELDGIGPVVASRLLGRTGHAGRFTSCAAFANYAGVAPVEVASAQKARHRLPRGGDRQLDLALHVIALTQVRMRASAGRAYFDRKTSEGKTHNEAMRCLKRRLADRVWRTMTADERATHERAGADPGGHLGRLCRPARLAQPRTPALRTSHFPDPPKPSLRPRLPRLDKHRGTPACPETLMCPGFGGVGTGRGVLGRVRPQVPTADDLGTGAYSPWGSSVQAGSSERSSVAVSVPSSTSRVTPARVRRTRAGRSATLATHPCESVYRGLVEVRRGDVAVLAAIAWIDMTEQADATALKTLVDRPGTGNVNQLPPPRGQRAVSVVEPAYASQQRGRLVITVEAEPVAVTKQQRVVEEVAEQVAQDANESG